MTGRLLVAGLAMGAYQACYFWGVAKTWVVPTAVAYTLYVIGLRTTPVTVSGVLTLAEPLTATLLGVLFFGDRLGLSGGLGTALLLSAVLGLTIRR